MTNTALRRMLMNPAISGRRWFRGAYAERMQNPIVDAKWEGIIWVEDSERLRLCSVTTAGGPFPEDASRAAMYSR